MTTCDKSKIEILPYKYWHTNDEKKDKRLMRKMN